jgi:glycosyltransferase involved in cell wall biosynthesis
MCFLLQYGIHRRYFSKLLWLPGLQSHMHIALVTHKIVKGDGQGRVNYEIAQAALEAGHTLSLIASEISPHLSSYESVESVVLPVAQYPTELIRNQVFAWRSARWIQQHRATLDALVSNGAITWPSVDVNVAHFVHSAWIDSPVHTSQIHRGPYGWYQWFYTKLNAVWERRAFDVATRVVAVSSQVQQELVAIGVAPSKTVTIPNGVDLEEFYPGRSDRDFFGLPDHVPLGVFVGDLRTPRKNLDTVLRAVCRVSHVHLAIAGTVSGSPYPDLARSLGIEQRVHFLGFCDEVPKLMRSADVCLCPSRYEPFSLVLLEALASGCPVITARSVGAAELLPGEAGWIVDNPDDDAAIADCLQEAVSSSALSTMRCAAREAAEAHSFDHMAQSYVQLIEEEWDQ